MYEATDSYCERCGTRYAIESVRSKALAGNARLLAKAARNFVMRDGSSVGDAVKEARQELQASAASQYSEAFYAAFNFCMSCRQYVCKSCWNEAAGECIGCSPAASDGGAVVAEPSAILVATVPEPISLGGSEVDLSYDLLDHADRPELELPIEPTEPIESRHPVESVQPLESVEPRGPIESVQVESVQPLESVEPREPIESVQPIESVEPVESVESVEPVESTQPVESAQPVESVQPSDQPAGFVPPVAVGEAATAEGLPPARRAPRPRKRRARAELPPGTVRAASQPAAVAPPDTAVAPAPPAFVLPPAAVASPAVGPPAPLPVVPPLWRSKPAWPASSLPSWALQNGPSLPERPKPRECANCAFPLSANVRFCRRCGTAQDIAPA